MKKNSLASTWSEIWAYTVGARTVFFMAIICAVFSSCLSLVQPQIVNQLIAKVQKKDFALQHEAFLLILLILLTAVLSGIQIYLTGRIGETVTKNARLKLSHQMLHLPISYYSDHSSGEFVSRLINDTTLMKSLLSKSLVSLLASTVTIVGCVGALIWLDFTAFAISFIMAALSIVIVAFASKPARKKSIQIQKIIAKISAYLQEIVGSIKFIRANCIENVMERKLRGEIKTAYENGISLTKINAFAGPLNQLSVNISLITAVIVCGIRVAAGSMTLPNLVSFLMFFMMLVGPIGQLGGTIFDLQGALAGQDRMKEIFELPAISDNRPVRVISSPSQDKSDMHSVKALLSFKNVYFSFNDHKPILNDVSFEIIEHEHVALIGESGVGKTTLFGLIEQFYQPRSGSIYFDGMDIAEVPANSIRKDIGYVDQESSVITGTVRSNLNPNLQTFSEEEYNFVLRSLKLNGLVSSLPEGIDTEIGDRGSRLSGGEKQRLSIARVLLQKPRLLLLDEPTANLDSETERAVLRAIETICPKSTILMVTHRDRTAALFDKTIILENHSIRVN